MGREKRNGGTGEIGKRGMKVTWNHCGLLSKYVTDQICISERTLATVKVWHPI